MKNSSITKKEHKKLALLAAKQAMKVLPYFEKRYPKDKRPRKAIQAARDWAHGKIKCGEARKAALAAHAAARRCISSSACSEQQKNKNLAEQFAARACGHAAATAHVARHWLGVKWYSDKIKNISKNSKKKK